MKIEGNRLDFEEGDTFICSSVYDYDADGDVTAYNGTIKDGNRFEFIADTEGIETYFNEVEDINTVDELVVKEPFSIEVTQISDSEALRKEGFGTCECVSRGSVEGLLVYKIHNFEREE